MDLPFFFFWFSDFFICLSILCAKITNLVCIGLASSFVFCVNVVAFCLLEAYPVFI